MPSSEDMEKEIVSKLSQVFTRCPRNMLSTSLPTDLESTAAAPDPPHFVSLHVAPSLPTVEMVLQLLQIWIFVLLTGKINNLVLNILFPMIALPYCLVSLLCTSFVSILSLIKEH